MYNFLQISLKCGLLQIFNLAFPLHSFSPPKTKKLRYLDQNHLADLFGPFGLVTLSGSLFPLDSLHIFIWIA